jgi:hypothetical protein
LGSTPVPGVVVSRNLIEFWPVASRDFRPAGTPGATPETGVLPGIANARPGGGIGATKKALFQAIERLLKDFLIA